MAAFVYLLTIVAIGSIQVEASAVKAIMNKHLTYNTALFDFSFLPRVLPVNREERRDGIIQALNGSDADLVCLEEVWIGQDVEAIVNGVVGTYPYSYSMLHDENGTLPDQANGLNEPACNTTVLTNYLNCTEACATLPFDSYLKGACTYLSTIENPGAREPFWVTRFPTLEEQNLFEVTALANAFRRERPFVLLGAINVGLAFTPDITPIAPENYRELRCAFEQTLPANNCTLCSGDENPYNVDQGRARSTIDHVLGNGLFFREGEIVFSLATNSVDINGTDYPLSDHYGYQASSYYRPVSHA